MYLCSQTPKKLTIAILLCDRDFKYVPDLLQSISENVHITYEVVLIDNRSEYINEPLDFKNFKYFKFGYNARQLIGRKKAVELSSGNYIWFVDADDQILPIISDKQNLLEKNFDIISFNYFIDDTFSSNISEDLVEENLLDKELLREIGVPLWNKWIKKSVLESVEQFVPDNESASASEDTVLVMGSLKYSKKLFKCGEVFYRFNAQRSMSAALCYKTVNEYERIIYGHTSAMKVMNTIFADEEKKAFLFDDIMIEDCAFFINKLLYCDDTIIEDCVKLVSEYFSKSEIIKAYKKYVLYTKEWTKRKYIVVRNCFQKLFPKNTNDFIFINVIKDFIPNPDGSGEMKCIHTERTELLPDFSSDY